MKTIISVSAILWVSACCGQTPAKMPDFSTYVTNAAVKSGNASDTTVWAHPPVDGDWLGIPDRVTINWDLTTCPRLGGIYISGTLDAGKARGALVVNAGTIFVDMCGAFLAGDCPSKTPLAGDSLTVTFLNAPIDPLKDPGAFGTGLLTMAGVLNLCGSKDKTGWVWTAGCREGDTTITLSAAPNDWAPGDRLLIPGCFLSPVEDEVIAIQSVSGNIVTLAGAVRFDHLPVPQPQGQPNNLPIGNLTRRIVFRSENPTGTRGHCMFMAADGMPSVVDVSHVAVKDCGRTLATAPATDPMVDSSGALIPPTAANPRARYAWHSHLQGQAADALQTWDTVVVEGFTKWAFDNHDSNVKATNLIAYDGQGASFATERGTEIGTYTDCLGVRTSGAPGLELDRLAAEDFGWQGDGMWLQGPGVTATGNVFAGHPDAGFHIMTMGPRPPAPVDNRGVLAFTFPRALLPPSFKLKSPKTDPLIVQVPYFGVSNNVAFGCAVGHFANWNQTDTAVAFTTPLFSTITAPISWNCATGLLLTHVNNAKIDSPVLTGPNFAAGSVGHAGGPAYVNNVVIKSPQIAGFEVGVNMQQGHTVSDGYYSNVWDFLDQLPNHHQIVFLLTGSPVFAAMDPTKLAERTPLNFKMGRCTRYFYDLINLKNVNDWFYPTTYLLPGGLEVFRVEQSPEFVPVPTTDTNGLPQELVGLTNAQIKARFRMCVGDKLAGAPAQSPYTTNGIISQAQPNRPCYFFGGGGPTSAWTTSTSRYRLSVYDHKSHQAYVDPSFVTLEPGWNRLTRTIRGQTYTFWVRLAGASVAVAPTTLLVTTSTESRAVTLSAKVSSSSAVSEGTITFTVLSGETTVATAQAQVSAGQATATIAIQPGRYTLQSQYSGAADLGASTKSQELVVQ